MVEDALSFWTEIQRYEDMLAADSKSLCFAPLSDLYRKLGLLDDAISTAQKGCAAHPEYALGFVALGNAFNAKGQAAEARQALERAIALKPDHIQAMKALSQIYVELGEIPLARQVLGQLLTRDPDDLESTMLMNSLASAPASAPAAAPEEELLEEVEIIEELEEVIEEPAPQAAASGSAQPASVAAPAASAAPVDELEDIWAIEDLEEPGLAQRPTPEHPKPSTAPDPLTTATLAELYVSQGFLEKAIGIYRELISAHPSNQQYRLRCEELVEITEAPPAMEVPVSAEETTVAAAFAGIESPAEQEAAPLEQAPASEVAVPGEDLESALHCWLENIRRRRDGV